MRTISRVVFAALIATTLFSCGGDTTAPPVLTTLNVSFPATIQVGQSATATAVGLDQHGASIATGTITWSTSPTGFASVNSSGVVTGVGAGQTLVIAKAGGTQGVASVTVTPIPVARVTVLPASAMLDLGATLQLTATALDANNNTLTARVVTWGTSDQTKATVSSTGVVTAVAAGPATITATSEGQSGVSQLTVSSTQASCTAATALQLALGGIHPLTDAEKGSLCLGGGASASEYVLIPFNNATSAASLIQVEITGTNTAAIQPGALASLQPRASLLSGSLSGLTKASPRKSFEWAFRERERRDLASVFASRPRTSPGALYNIIPLSRLTGIPPTPVVGSTVQINANILGNSCTDAKQLHDALVVAVLPHTIVLSDATSPAGGYTTAEMTAFGQSFDTLGYALDIANFGAPTDIDSNGRIAILFTPGVNVIPVPPGAIIGGLFAARDLFPADPTTGCPGSNEGEMFYMPVPDPNSTINGNYVVKANVARPVLSTLAHEFQHLINAGRRIYVNNASDFEEVWLNEGLSHIAEELLYYRISGNAPRSNIDLGILQSSQAQVDAVNTYQLNNLGRLLTYMESPEINSPFSQVDGLEMRGAIWQLLRYSADRKGGVEANTWFALVNSTLSGQPNFNSVFGDIITNSRDWAVAQFVDDAGLNVPTNLTNPSWNARSVLPAINKNVFPLLTHPLLGTPLDIILDGGGAAYVRFSVAANIPATIAATSSSQPVPTSVDFILVRTR